MVTQSMIKITTPDNKNIYSVLYSDNRKEKVVILVHGACMNFMTGMSLFVPQMTNSFDKYDFLSVNTRAHDMGYITNVYSEREGWAWQTLEKNRYDLEATVSYLHKNGYNEIIFCAHSWGGLICLDYLQNCNSNIEGIILLSPTVSYRLLLEVNFRDSMLDVIQEAQKLISENKSNDIIATSEKSPLPCISAKTIYEFYNSSFEIEYALNKLNCRVDIIIGSLEHKKLIKFGKEIAQKRNNIQTHIIKGANHFYYGHEIDVVNIIDSILCDK